MTTTPLAPLTPERPVESVASVKIPTAPETAEGRRLLDTHGKLMWRRWGHRTRRACFAWL